MKKTLLLVSLVSAVSSYVPQASAEDNLSLRVCEYVSINDKSRLKGFLKSNKLKIRTIFDNILCNNQNLLEFAASSNALDIGEYMIGQLPVSIVNANIIAIEKHSAHLAVVAKKRVG